MQSLEPKTPSRRLTTRVSKQCFFTVCQEIRQAPQRWVTAMLSGAVTLHFLTTLSLFQKRLNRYLNRNFSEERRVSNRRLQQPSSRTSPDKRTKTSSKKNSEIDGAASNES